MKNKTALWENARPTKIIIGTYLIEFQNKQKYEVIRQM